MLRISQIAEDPVSATLRLEGRIASDWVAVLEAECQRVLRQKRRLRLDFTHVTYVDAAGVRVLKRIGPRDVEILNCPALIGHLPGTQARP